MQPSLSAVLGGIRDLIVESDVEAALKQLPAVLEPIDRRLRDEVLLHASAFREEEDRNRRGVVTADAHRAERLRIISALLAIVSEVEGKADPAAPAPMLSDPAPSPDDLEKIFGRSHLRPVAWLEKGTAAARSVCRVVTPSGLGSGFVVKPGVIATAHHVVHQDEAARTYVEMNYEVDERGNLKHVESFYLDAQKYRADPKSDLAVCGLKRSRNQPPFSRYPPLRLRTDPPRVDEEACIIQHPDGRPKEIAPTSNSVVKVFAKRLQYLTDTLPGSSGSPVFDAEWRVVAVHTRGGYLATNKRGDRRAYVNEGVLARFLEPLLS